MDALSLIVGLCDIACGLVFALLGAMLAAFRIPMNSWYGFRVRNAVASEENWDRVNRFGGQRLVTWAIPLIMAGVICVFLAFPPPDCWMAPVGLLPIFIFVAIPILETTVYARHLPSGDGNRIAPTQPSAPAHTH
jgi:hypothetical protein